MRFKLINRKGFTIVELMIAISVFSVASTLVIMGVLFVGRQYQQASTRTEIEEASRGFHQQLLQSIQYTSTNISTVTGTDYTALCVGDQVYLYGSTSVTDETSYDNQKSGLYVINGATNGCVPDSYTNVTNNQNLLPEDAKVITLAVDPVSGTLKTVFAKSGGDLLGFDSDTGTVSCKTAVTGRQWCAVVGFESTAKRRML